MPRWACCTRACARSSAKEWITPPRQLAGRDGLRVSHAEATDTLFVLYSPDVAIMLFFELGWTPDQYEAWLVDMIGRTLMRSA